MWKIRRKMRLIYIVLAEIYFLLKLFFDKLSIYEIIALILCTFSIACLLGAFDGLYDFILDKLIRAREEKEKKKQQEKREDGTLAGEELVVVQNLKAPLEDRVTNLIWLTRSLIRSCATNKKKKLLKAIAQYNDEFGKPMDEMALRRFIHFYGNDFLKNECIDEYTKNGLSLLMEEMRPKQDI